MVHGENLAIFGHGEKSILDSFCLGKKEKKRFKKKKIFGHRKN
jgi:hypothetical protein